MNVSFLESWKMAIKKKNMLCINNFLKLNLRHSSEFSTIILNL